MSLLLKRFPILPNPFALLLFSTFQRPLIVLSNFGSGVDTSLTKFYQVCLMAESINQKLSASDIPDGWNDDHYRLKSAAEAFPAEDYGLPPANLILVDQDRSTFLVDCGGKYFFWNDISGDVARIDEPTGLSNILQAMKDSGKLKTVRLEMPGALESS